jgi:hypothetical protein
MPPSSSPRLSRPVLGLASLLLSLGATSPAPAQKPLLAPETWGTSAISFVQIPPASFRPRSDTVQYNTGSVGENIVVTGSGGFFPDFAAGVSLPSGAQIVYVELDFKDVSPVGEVIAYLVVCDFGGDACNGYPSPYLRSGAAFNGGTAYVAADVSSEGLIVDNYRQHYSLVAALGAPLDVELRGMVVGYVLRVSPPPASAFFNDVPTNHAFFQFVEALRASGITAGCGTAPPLYCPDAPLTRGQMAVFLAKALGLHFQ